MKYIIKNLFYLLVLLFLISLWLHEPWQNLYNWLTDINTHFPPRLEFLLSAFIAVFLVFLVEWLKGSSIKFIKIDSLEIPEDNPQRKFLKIGVTVKERWIYKVFKSLKLPPYVHSFATLTVKSNHKDKKSYRIKWDISPEPLEYPHSVNQSLVFEGKYSKKNHSAELIKIQGTLRGRDNGFPRVEMIPLTMQGENLLPEDTATASFLVKHKDQPGFYIYDPEYYFDDAREKKNYCNYKKLYLRIIFKSSLTSKDKYFCILNPDTSLEKFSYIEITQELYESRDD